MTKEMTYPKYYNFKGINYRILQPESPVEVRSLDGKSWVTLNIDRNDKREFLNSTVEDTFFYEFLND